MPVERAAVMECLKREAKGKKETTAKQPTSPANSVSTISATLCVSWCEESREP